VQKTSDFSKFMAWTWRVEPVQTRKEGPIFCNLVQTSFIGYFKMTTLLALNLKKIIFLKCLKHFQSRTFFKWLVPKVIREESGSIEKSCSPSSLPVVVSQPNKRHANRTASVLEYHDRHRVCSIWFKRRRFDHTMQL